MLVANPAAAEMMAKPISANALYLRIEEIILRPRQFVSCESYLGPDRRRRNDELYSGERRRKTDQEQADDQSSVSDTGGTSTSESELESS